MHYMAPEAQAKKRYNTCVDFFYSYGMVLVWMFEGHADEKRWAQL